ncbi:MAG: hypothetical protein OEY19_03245 [Gammaproteobacteria bacterium]|nr:hypothetical protein [Gammaproteobacteria bacterium]MDH5628723.1 hypothetical protein [Gammaproteobacteria bacterium]
MTIDQTEIYEKSPVGVVVCDKYQRVLWCNDKFLNDSKLDQSTVVGQLYLSLPIEVIDNHCQILPPDGDKSNNEQLRFSYWQSNVDTPSGAVAHYFVSNRTNHNTVKVSAHNLPQRPNWLEFLDYEVSRSRRYGNPLSLLKLHLIVFQKPDDFSEEVLHQTIKVTLNDEMRWSDMVGHTEHGSYLIVLPETPFDALDNLKDKLKKTLSKRLDTVNGDIKYDIVFGGSSWQRHDDTKKILARARDSLVKHLEDLLAAKN